jgi:type II secretory pathway pseudopilin PulG
MVINLEKQAVDGKAGGAFTLIEVVFCTAVIALMAAGLIYGYVQANNFSQWSAMSLSAQSIASAGAEQMRAAKWDPYSNVDDLNLSGSQSFTTNMMGSIMVPTTGQLVTVTNTVTVSPVNAGANNIYLRQILSQCVWKYPPSTNSTGRWFTNAIITFRGPKS